LTGQILQKGPGAMKIEKDSGFEYK